MAYRAPFSQMLGEVRAWTVPIGSTAPRGWKNPYRFEKGFIRAEAARRDFVRLGGEQAAKDAGKWRLEGKLSY